MSNLAPAVGLSIKLITLLSEQTEAIGISEISRKLDINKNMVSRILNSLEEEGWVYSNKEAKYRLSLLPFQITSKAVTQLSLTNVATPYVYDLWKRFGESTYLGILKDQHVLYIEHFDSIQDVRVAGVIGGTYPLYCTAPGKVLLAFCENAYIEKYLLGSFKKHTERTLTSCDDIKNELNKIRNNGYAIDNEEFGRGIVCLAAPIFDYRGAVAGTVGCSFSTINCSAETIFDQCGSAVIQTAEQISRCLGCETLDKQFAKPV